MADTVVGVNGEQSPRWQLYCGIGMIKWFTLGKDKMAGTQYSEWWLDEG